MTRATQTSLGLLAASVLLSGGCTQVEKIREDTGSGAGIPAEVQRVFDDRCATAGCHDSTTRAKSLDLSSSAAASIIGGESEGSVLPLVELGNVSGSYLAVKIPPSAPPGVAREGGRMPTAGDFNSEELATDLALILGWIAGADLPGGDDNTDGVADDGPDTLACSIFALAPGVMSPVITGTTTDTLPVEIGDVLDRNCGCHYATTLQAPVAPYSGPVGIATFQDFHAEYPGTNPAYADLQTRDAVQDRVADAVSPMPPTSCVLEDGSPITESDKDLLLDWLSDGAPDAPTWSGIPGTGG